MQQKIRTIKEQGDELFSKRTSLLSLWQEQAENFYPERADFTVGRSLGVDFAAGLTTSYPILARRDLANTFSSMLRPKEAEWFKLATTRDDRLDNESRAWLEWATKLQRNAMYDRTSQFVRATKEGDNDFATFGQCALSVQLNAETNSLLYKSYHLRDVAWVEGPDCTITEIHRKWKPTARVLNTYFKGNVSQRVKDALEKDPLCEIEVRHAVVPSDQYDLGKRVTAPYVSVYYEVESCHINEEVASNTQIYIIPRWQTVSGSQYAYSPCTIAALPDARLIQAMTLVLLEAGQKAVEPPLIATQDVVRSDVAYYPGGITWIDAEYDERMGAALRPMEIDGRGIPIGMDMRNDTKGMIADAFYLNKINMPPLGGREMTAYEIGQRVQQYVRDALPLFEPMEMEYNGALCDMTFDVLMRSGGFGAPDTLPRLLRGQEIKFKFASPLHEQLEKQKGQMFLQSKAMLAEAAALDPAAINMMDARKALREVLYGIGTPADWIREEAEMAALSEQEQEKQEAAQIMQAMQQGGEAAQSVAKAGQEINAMQMGA